MMKNKFFAKVDSGNALNEKEINKLAEYIGVKPSYLKIIVSILAIIIWIFIFLIFIGVFSFYKGNYVLAWIFFFSYLIIFSVINFRFYDKRFQIYLSCIDLYYKKTLKEHSEMQKIYTRNIPSPDSYIVKNSVLLLTDGYYFYVREDFLLQTKWFLNKKYKTKYNPYPLLKVLDSQSIGKREVMFKLSDIESYEIIGEYTLDFDHNLFEEYLHVFDLPSYENYILIEMKDKKTWKFGCNVYEVLKDIIPLREKENEDKNIS